jgi:hypothetical protein
VGAVIDLSAAKALCPPFDLQAMRAKGGVALRYLQHSTRKKDGVIWRRTARSQ